MLDFDLSQNAVVVENASGLFVEGHFGIFENITYSQPIVYSDLLSFCASQQGFLFLTKSGLYVLGTGFDFKKAF